MTHSELKRLYWILKDEVGEDKAITVLVTFKPSMTDAELDKIIHERR